MMKHQGQNIPMKVSQKKEKQTKTSALTNLMLQILPDDEITEGINSLAKESLQCVSCMGQRFCKI